MKARVMLIVTSALICLAAGAQVPPAATVSNATLFYDVRYSQTVQQYSGADQSTVTRSVASGELSYSSGSANKPLNLTWSGGDMWAIQGPDSGEGAFVHFLLSQGLIARLWSLTFSDDVSYLPQSATTGFSGIPGVGGLPGVPGLPDQPILLGNTRSVGNHTMGSFSRSLQSNMTIGITAVYSILRFPDGDGLEVNQVMVSPQLSFRLNSLNSLSLGYSFGHFMYPGSSFTMQTQAAMFGFSRTWNRRLKTSGSAGPEWTSSSLSLLVPPSTALSANASLDYQARKVAWSLNYYQATSAGVGTSNQLGLHNSSATISAAPTFGREFSLSASGTYCRSEGLTQNGVVNGAYGSVQGRRRLGQYFATFASYSLIKQTSSLALTSNAVSGWSNVFSFGISYSPRNIRISMK